MVAAVLPVFLVTAEQHAQCSIYRNSTLDSTAQYP
jgi:hypothetical protein